MIKRLMPFLFAGFMGVVAVAMMQGYLARQRQSLELERKKLLELYKEQVEIVVAQQDLPVDTIIEAQHLGRETIPQKFVQPYATSRLNDVVGLMTTAPIAKGEQVLRNKLRRQDQLAAGMTLSGVTPEGMRAVTITTDPVTGVGGFVRPGDTVDVLWTFAMSEVGGGREGERMTVTLFQDVTILTVGNQMVGEMGGQQEGAGNAFAMTLALTPKQTSLLSLARDRGRIHLSLRSRADSGQRMVVAPENMGTLMEAALGKGAPKSSARVQRTVEVFKGLERSVVAVNE